MAPKRSPATAAERFEGKASWHRAQAALPPREKFKILLKLQAEELPLLQKRRTLASWEKPWAIKP